MNRTRRLSLVAAGLALGAAASVGAGSAQAETAPVTVLRTANVACAGVDGVTAVCVEDPATTISRLPRARQLVYDLTGVG